MNDFRSKLSTRVVRLRTVFIVPFVLLVVGTAGLVGYLSFKNGQRTVANLAGRLINEVGHRVEQHLDNYLTAPHQINQMNLHAIEAGLLDLNDFERLSKYFWQQQQMFDFGYINYGNEIGEFIGVGYVGDVLEIDELSKSDLNKLYSYAPDEQGNRASLIMIHEDVHPNDAAWYAEAVAAGQPIWSPVYQWADFPDVLAISASYPVYNEQQIIGVLGVDLIISQISDFLRMLDVGRSGKIFIIERSGLLIASSSEAPAYKIVNGAAQRLRASESSDKLIRTTTHHLRKRFDNLGTINGSQQINFTIEGQRQFVQIISYQDEFGLDWLIVVTVPESDFLTQINTNSRLTMLLSALALLAAIIIGALTARRVTEPILQLNAAAKEIAQGNWQRWVAIERHDEVGELAVSFNQMAQQLQHSFTELAALNDNLLANERRLRQFLDALPVGVSVHKPDGKLIYLNQIGQDWLVKGVQPDDTWEKLISSQQLYLASTDQLYPLQQLPAIQALQGHTVTADDLELRQNGITTYLEMRATPIFDDQGQIIYIINAFRDITERKRAEEELRQHRDHLELLVAERATELAATNRQLQQELNERIRAQDALARARDQALQASRLKSELLAKVSHELRTPLNAILGFTEMLQVGVYGPITAEQQQPTLEIINSTHYLASLVNELLDQAQLDAGKLKLNITLFSLKDMIGKAQTQMQTLAQIKGLRLTTEIADDLPQMLLGDPARLQQILTNLVSNAVKFTETGTVQVNIYQSKVNHWTMQVADTGPGIPAEAHALIFEPFGQVDGSVTRQQRGTGLGLSIVKQLTELMGGEITLASEVGRGSTFTVRLPLKPNASVGARDEP